MESEGSFDFGPEVQLRWLQAETPEGAFWRTETMAPSSTVASRESAKPNGSPLK
jgi:hypothetical protein